MNKLSIISAEERAVQKRGIKGCIFGKSGVGKTSLLWTLDSQKTLFWDLEAGDLAIEGWKGDTVRPKTWQDCRDLAAFLGGGNDALSQNQAYSQAHYESVCQQFGDKKVLDKYDTIFIDSITVAGRLCFQWCSQLSYDKTGKSDIRATYGLLGQEMVSWLVHLQHVRDKNIWFLGILDERVDEFNRRYYVPQIEGSKTGLELPGILDQVITMAEIGDENGSYRSFINHTINPYGYPAKDRSGRLGIIEEPHLGKLMEKIKAPMSDRDATLEYSIQIGNIGGRS